MGSRRSRKRILSIRRTLPRILASQAHRTVRTTRAMSIFGCPTRTLPSLHTLFQRKSAFFFTFPQTKVLPKFVKRCFSNLSDREGNLFGVPRPLQVESLFHGAKALHKEGSAPKYRHDRRQTHFPNAERKQRLESTSQGSHQSHLPHREESEDIVSEEGPEPRKWRGMDRDQSEQLARGKLLQ